MNDLAPLMLGIVLGAFVLSCLIFERIGRATGKIIAVVGIGLGVGLLTWGIYSAIEGELQPLQAGPIVFKSIGQVIGWGAGLLGGGVTALVLAFVGLKAESSR